MDGFSFVDIYSTKGIEYLVAVVFFFGFLGLQYYLLRSGPGKMETLPSGPDVPLKFRMPEGYSFHQGHSWMKADAVAGGSGSLVRVGANDFALKLVGKVDGIEIPPVGSRVEQGKKGWSLHVDSARIPMLSPVTGVVTAVNGEVLRSPGVVLRRDPYAEGWLFQVKPDRISRDARHLLSGNVARTWMENSLANLMPAQDEALGPVLQDGGLPVDGIAKALGGDMWQGLAMEHLLVAGEDSD